MLICLRNRHHRDGGNTALKCGLDPPASEQAAGAPAAKGHSDHKVAIGVAPFDGGHIAAALLVPRWLIDESYPRSRPQIEPDPRLTVSCKPSFSRVGQLEHVLLALRAARRAGWQRLAALGKREGARKHRHDRVDTSKDAQLHARIHDSALQVDQDGALHASLPPPRASRRGRRDAIGIHPAQRGARHNAEVGALLRLQQRRDQVRPQIAIHRHDRIARVEPRAMDLVDGGLREARLLGQPIMVLLYPRREHACAVQRSQHVVSSCRLRLERVDSVDAVRAERPCLRRVVTDTGRRRNARTRVRDRMAGRLEHGCEQLDLVGEYMRLVLVLVRRTRSVSGPRHLG
mmetsp:Transcript_43518/g.114374  ORF Transcript_43518/g.114374 Transcript_43518/m.114374 type:complete len:345 (+) Transcript_43518:290-1324(+)